MRFAKQLGDWMKIKKILIWFIGIIVTICVIIGFGAMMINNHVVSSQKENLIYQQDSSEFKPSKEAEKQIEDFDAECILVLGAGIKDSETPSPMLKDRLDTAISLYESKAAPKILLTGDNGTEYHNEIHVMLTYMLNAGIPEDDIFCDHAGFSTYDSMYRAKNIFKVSKMIVVTQTYHEYRALYIGNKLGTDCIGVASDQEKYSGQAIREIREIAARTKDVFKCAMKKGSSVGGTEIPISGTGKESHGE